MTTKVKAIIPVAWCYTTWTVWCLIMAARPELQDTGNALRSIIRILVVLTPAIYFMRKYRTYEHVRDYKRGIAVGLVISAAIALSSYLVQIQLQGMAYRLPSGLTVWLNWIVLSPLAEELLFRGVVFPQLKKAMHWFLAALLSSLFFVGLHLPHLILIDHQSSVEILKYCTHLYLVSLMFTYAVHKSKSLWASILPHWTNNLISMGIL